MCSGTVSPLSSVIIVSEKVLARCSLLHRQVVICGTLYFISGIPSNPVTITSSGTRNPCFFSTETVVIAMVSFAQIIACGSRLRRLKRASTAFSVGTLQNSP